MRLVCNVVVASRSSANCSKSKPCRGVLTIFQDPKRKMVNLRISTSLKPNETVLVDKGNITAVFSKYSSDGMTTIRFEEPSIDVMISKADPVQLSAFLKVLNAAVNGNPTPALQSISSSHQASSSASKIAGPAKLVIAERRDYPFWNPFPQLLIQLSVKNCRLTEFDGRVLKLKHLTHLTLSGNNFSNGRLNEVSLSPLRQLVWIDLSNNQIDQLSGVFCGSLPSGLKVLSLASNRLTGLPDSLFEKAAALTSLDVSKNQIGTFNKNIKKLKSTLIDLDASNNCLAILPVSLARLRLKRVDFTANPASRPQDKDDTVNELDLDDYATIPSLVEQAAVSIALHRIPSSCLPVSLQSYVSEITKSTCDVCHRLFPPSKTKMVQSSLDLVRISAIVSTNRHGSNHEGRRVKVEGKCCSSACAKALMNGKF